MADKALSTVLGIQYVPQILTVSIGWRYPSFMDEEDLKT